MKSQLFIAYNTDSRQIRKNFKTEVEMDEYCRELLKNRDLVPIEVVGFYGPSKLGMFVFQSPLPKGVSHDH